LTFRKPYNNQYISRGVICGIYYLPEPLSKRPNVANPSQRKIIDDFGQRDHRKSCKQTKESSTTGPEVGVTEQLVSFPDGKLRVLESYVHVDVVIMTLSDIRVVNYASTQRKTVTKRDSTFEFRQLQKFPIPCPNVRGQLNRIK
jgi:hypothetical protein